MEMRVEYEIEQEGWLSLRYLKLTLKPRIQLIRLPFTLLSLQYVLQGEVCTVVPAPQEISLLPHQIEAMKSVSFNDASDSNHITSSIQLLDHNSCDFLKYAGHCAWTNWEKEADFSLGDTSADFSIFYLWQPGVKEDDGSRTTRV